MKKMTGLFFCFLILISITSCGSGLYAGSKTTTKQRGIIEYPFDEPIIAIDNDYLRIQITGKMYVDPKKPGDWMSSGGAVGYSYVLENKILDASIMVGFWNSSIDGFMLDQQAGPYNTINSFAAGKKGTGYFYIPLDGRDLGVNIETIDDFHDFDGEIILSFSEDGNGYSRYYHGENIPNLPLLTTIP